MFRTVVSRCLIVTCVLLAASAARAADESVDKFIAQVISGIRTNSACATKLIEAAAALTSQPKICAAVLEKAIEYGTKSPVTPAGCQAASGALEMLAAEFPDRKDEWTLKQAGICGIKYRYAKTESAKQESGGKFLTALLAAGEIHEKNGNWTEAVAMYRQAGPVDTYLKMGGAENLRQKLKIAEHFSMVAKRVAMYSASLKKDPSNASTRGMLVKTLMVELDDPKSAIKYLNEDVDETWRTYVPIAAKGLDELSETVCLELGHWYYKELSQKALAVGKGALLRRAQSYYKRFGELHTTADIQAIRAKSALTEVVKQLAKLNTPLSTGGSKSLPKGKKLATLSLGNGVTMKFVKIPAGKFIMSSPESEKGRLPREGAQRIVTISKPFYMSITEVTQSQWIAVMSTESWAGKDNVQSNPNNPATYVSRNDARGFCGRLSGKVGKTIMLPTEAQWEYACRAGTKTAFYFGDDPSQLSSFAWFSLDKKGAEYFPHPVGQKKPNAWGLYDMHGNVYEWCNDYYVEDAYATAKTVDPQGPESGKAHVVRGGSFKEISNWCRSAHRHMYRGLDRKAGVGFRVVIVAGKG